MDKIGKYEISRLLGEGATSNVYLGFDPFTQREVAIKRLHPEALRGSERSALYRNQLLNEASLAGKLQHPHIIQIHDAVIDERETYVVVMEKLDDMLLMNTADDPKDWRTEHIEAAVRGIAEVHSIWYKREDELQKEPWLGPVQTTASMVQMSELWDALLVHGANEFPEFVTEAELEMLRALVRGLPQWWARLEAMPRTLIHNDFNPRNLGLRREGLRLCAYDWELATLHVPQRDLAELLCFVLDEQVDPKVVDHYVELHRRTLSECSGHEIDSKQWRDGYWLALCDFAINRLCQYLMAHTVRRYGFIRRVLNTTRTLLLLERDRGQTPAG